MDKDVTKLGIACLNFQKKRPTKQYVMKLEMTVASLELVESTLVLPYDKAAYPTSLISTASAPGFRTRFAWLGLSIKNGPLSSSKQ